MSHSAQCHQAGLIFTDDSDVTVEQLLEPVKSVLRAFGQQGETMQVDFDQAAIASQSVLVELQIFDAPEADPDTLRVLSSGPRTHLSDASREALENPTFWVHVSICETAYDDRRHPEASKAMLAEIVHRLIAETCAPFVQWLDRETVLTSARFQSAFNPISLRDTDITALHHPMHPARVAHPETATMASQPVRSAVAAEIFPEIQSETSHLDARFDALRAELKARRQNTWVGTDPAGVTGRSMNADEELRDVFRAEMELDEEADPKRLEHRVATYTVNATVALINPPVAGALLAYNMIRGEDFRISTHALTLSTVFAIVGTGATQVMAETLALLPI
ncbi:MAG: hypothetical protein GYB53_16700 [Rhodobacteraceae bacterium]|nr:hypothetical protein [Paracoccaceae bacterium]MBR9822966.1 hypothetical protein [Paracoccaceae bacterium]